MLNNGKTTRPPPVGTNGRLLAATLRFFFHADAERRQRRYCKADAVVITIHVL